MRLQSIVFPNSERSEIKSLYYRPDDKIHILNHNRVIIDRGGTLDTGTYFNSISLNKWGEYTKVKQIGLKGRVKGHCLVEVYEMFFMENNVKEKCIFSSEQNFLKYEEINIILPEKLKGMCYVKIKSISDVELEGLHYFAEDIIEDNVKIVLVICTFKREAYVERNIKLIRERILQNSQALLYTHFDIVVVDNGQTLGSGFEDIQVIKNRNTGGSGGFTRGIIEALHQTEERGYTHILLMDDDVDIEPESFERMYSMLCILRDSYKEAFIGGAMLRRDEPWIQEESGAVWDGLLHSWGKGEDLSNIESIIKNDIINPVDYNAWWYCCMPVSAIGLDNLPLPFFIHCDDMEYGIRNAKSWILLNGICVWHEVAAVRKNFIRDYYDVRNFMILNILYSEKGYSKWRMTGALIRRLAAGLLMPQISFCMRINAIRDFFRGVEWWEMQEIDILHQQVSVKKGKATISDIIIVCSLVLLFPFFYKKIHDNYQDGWQRLGREKYWDKYLQPPSFPIM